MRPRYPYTNSTTRQNKQCRINQLIPLCAQICGCLCCSGIPNADKLVWLIILQSILHTSTYWGSLWGQTCCSVIDGKIQLKHTSTAKWTRINNIKNVVRVFFQGSAENLAAMWLDVLFIVHAKDSAFTMRRIQSYMLFFFHCNNNDVIMCSWFVSAHNSNHNGVNGIFVGHC